MTPKPDKLFFLVLLALIVLSMWLIVVTDAGATDTHEVYTPAQFTSVWPDDARCIHYPDMLPPCPTWDTGGPLP